jgi:hypothetical protein
MTDPVPPFDPSQFGLGAVQSPYDENDFPVSVAYELAGITAATTFPSVYRVPNPRPSIMNQGSKPECVVYSNTRQQRYFDLHDTGDFAADLDAYFAAIGGGPNGAVTRNGFAYRLHTGIPELGHPENAGKHRIGSYFSVPVTVSDFKAAIMAFGPIVITVPWSYSWDHPDAQGVLPAYTTLRGWHALEVDGWDDGKGWLWPNSWGAGFGVNGEVYCPYDQTGHIAEGWKATDITFPKPPPPPKPVVYSIGVAHGATVQYTTLNKAGRLVTPWTRYLWTSPSSGAPCGAPQTIKTDTGGLALVVLVTKNKFIHKMVRLASGVTLRRA